MEVAVEADDSVWTSSPTAEGLEHRGREVIVEADGVTVNDPEVVILEIIRRIKGIERRKRAA